jgi:hypothetical protein
MTKLRGNNIGPYDDALSSDGTYYGPTATMQVDDASSVFGSPLYVAADGNLERCSATSEFTMPCVAIALQSGAGAKLVLLPGGMIRNDSWSFSSVGEEVFVAKTAGAVVQGTTFWDTTGNVGQSIGMARSSGVIHFMPGPAVERA